jgi:hypothetical protein
MKGDETELEMEGQHDLQWKYRLQLDHMPKTTTKQVPQSAAWLSWFFWSRDSNPIEILLINFSFHFPFIVVIEERNFGIGK